MFAVNDPKFSFKLESSIVQIRKTSAPMVITPAGCLVMAKVGVGTAQNREMNRLPDLVLSDSELTF